MRRKDEDSQPPEGPAALGSPAIERLVAVTEREEPARSAVRKWWPVALLFLLNVLVQTWQIDRLVCPWTDEGTYLYSARLMTEGLIPYRDFSLSHPPWGLLPVAGALVVTGFRLPLFHFLYVLWVFSAIFPLFRVAERLCGSRKGALLAVALFSTFPELVQWDAHFYALRPAALPLLAWGLDALVVRRRSGVAGFLFGIFSLTTVSALALSVCLVFAWALEQLLFDRTSLPGKRGWTFPAGFALTVLVGYGPLFGIPRAFENLVRFQLERPRVPIADRLGSLVSESLPVSGTILVLGLVGSLVVNRRVRLFGLANLLGFGVTVFAFGSYYPHYLSILAVGLSVSSGVLLAPMLRSAGSSLIVAGAVVLSLAATALPRLADTLIRLRSPEELGAIEILRRAPEPILSYEPIYALRAGKRLTFHYYAADMRHFQVIGESLDDATFRGLLARSRTVLIESFFYSLLTPSQAEAVQKDFLQVYRNPHHVVLIRRGESLTRGPAQETPPGR